jgi:hypothetical protein
VLCGPAPWTPRQDAVHKCLSAALQQGKSEGFLMNDSNSNPVPPPQSTKQSFQALRHRGFQIQFVTYVLTMMADNIEHVISYG